MMKFKMLTLDEVKEYKRWAQHNHKPFGKISEVWHPIIQIECHLIDIAELKDIYAKTLYGVA